MESPEELFSTLEEYERDWYIGLVTEKGWHDSVLQEKPFLFSLGHDLAMVITATRPCSYSMLLNIKGHLLIPGYIQSRKFKFKTNLIEMYG